MSYRWGWAAARSWEGAHASWHWIGVLWLTDRTGGVLHVPFQLNVLTFPSCIGNNNTLCRQPDLLSLSPSTTQSLKNVTAFYSEEAMSVQWGEDWNCNWRALGLEPSLFKVFIMTTEMVHTVQLFVLMFCRQMILVSKHLPRFKSYSVLHFFGMLVHKPSCCIGSHPSPLWDKPSAQKVITFHSHILM